MAQTNAERLMALGMPGPLATELVAQINTGGSTLVALRAAVTAVTALTDSSGGTPGNTIVDVPGSYTEATLANQLSSLAVKLNAIRTAIVT